ncbi:MAG: hypothetical protein IJU66_06340 [Oscillospiraceae bacterium]|nr:hypothetical protein [Oscillospiraceae bacterium]
MKHRKACIVSFSSRDGGNCAQIAGLLQALTQDAVLYDFSRFALHACGGCAYECFADRDGCPYIGDMEREIVDAVIHSETAWFVLPNYCDYPPANYFIFNERSQCCFQGRPELLDRYLRVPKRFIVVSNTNCGNFAKALAYQTQGEPEILFLSAKKYGKTSIRGDLLTSEQALADVKAFAGAE